MPKLTVNEALDVLRSEYTVIYWREGSQPQFKRRVAELLKHLQHQVKNYRDTHGCEKADVCDLCRTVDSDAEALMHAALVEKP